MATIELDRTTGGRFSLADLPVNAKILLAVGIASLAAVTVGVTGLLALSRASASAQHIYTSSVAGVAAVGEVKAAFLQGRVDVTLHAATTGEAAKAKIKAAFATDAQAADTAIAAYRTVDAAGDAAVVNDLATVWQQYVNVVTTKMMPLSEQGDLESWQRVRTSEAGPLLTQAYKDLDAMGQAESQGAAATAASAQSSYRSSRLLSLTLLIVGLLTALAVGFLVARQIVRSLGRVKAVCAALAAGDLTQTAGLTSRDEPGQMGRSLDAAVARLRDSVVTINGSATSVAGAAEELSGVTTQIAASADRSTKSVRL